MRPRVLTARRRAAAVAALAAAALLAGACTSPAARFFEGGPSGNSLTITTFDAIDATILKQVGAEFTRRHPDLRVQVTQIPEDAYVTKLQTSILANNPPDIAYVYTAGHVSSFQPLDSLVYKKYGLDVADYDVPTLKYACGFKNRFYCVGGYAGALALFYNKKLFRAAGVPFPDTTKPMTFTEYSEVARKLSKPHRDPKKAVWGGEASVPTWWVDLRTFMSPDGRKVELTRPSYAREFETLVDMVRDGSAPTAAQQAAVGADEGNTGLFTKGKLAMTIGGGDMIDTLAGAKFPIDDYGLAATPVPSHTRPWINVWSTAYGIPRGSKHPAESAEFLALWGTYAQKLQADHNLMPMLRSAADRYFAPKGPRHAEFVQVARLARESLFTPDFYAWDSNNQDAFNAAVRGEDVASVLRTAQRKDQQALDTTWRQFDQAARSVGID